MKTKRRIDAGRAHNKGGRKLWWRENEGNRDRGGLVVVGVGVGFGLFLFFCLSVLHPMR